MHEQKMQTDKSISSHIAKERAQLSRVDAPEEVEKRMNGSERTASVSAEPIFTWGRRSRLLWGCQVPGLSSGSLAVTRGKSGSQRAKHFILPIQDLIEIREKTQNHMFCNHSARNTSWA